VESAGTVIYLYVEGLGQKYEFAFYQRCLQGLKCPLTMSKNISLKPPGFSKF
jgi:hypothetical protein